MSCSTDYAKAIDVLSSIPGIQAGLVDDELRLRRFFYGFRSLSFSGHENPVHLYIGGRSGLEGELLMNRTATATAIIVETNRTRRRTLQEIFRDQPRVQILDSIHDLSKGPGRFDFVRVDDPSQEILACLNAVFAAAPHGVHYLCGAFRSDEIDPLALYRASRRVESCFYWRDTVTDASFSGRTPTDPFDVSVIVPAYKVAGEIDTCIESLVHQTLDRLEIIIVNDGSPDATGAMADRWMREYPERVWVIHKENGGCASARMAGLQAARGTFVGFVDGDDWTGSGMFEALLRGALLTGSDVAECGYNLAYSDGSIEKNDEQLRGQLHFPGIGIVSKPIKLAETRPAIWRRIYKRDFLKALDIRFPEHIKRFDDLPFQFEVFCQARSVATVPGCYYYYRQGRPGQDIEATDEKLFVHMQLFDWLRDRILSWGNCQIEKQLLRVQINTHLWALSRIDTSLRQRYRQEASAQIARLRTSIRRVTALRIAAKKGWPAVSLVARVVLLNKPGKR